MQLPCWFLIPILVLLLGNIFLVKAQSSLRQLKAQEFQNKLDQKRSLSSAPSTPPSNYRKREGRVLYPTGYGADPRGEKESSSAIMEALEDAIRLLQNNNDMLAGIRDLGGLILDFQGGDFKISNPIVFPPRIGNLVVQGGTLRASNTFSGNRHLIELDAKVNNSDNNVRGSIHYEDVTFRDILFDSSLRGGGVMAIDSARIRITNCFFLGFTTQGILVRGGHETLVSYTFLGQHPTVGGSWDEKDFSGTAIDLASTDNAITDVVIFSAATGIVLRGQSNMITGVHCYNKAKVLGGIGILVEATQNRIDNCYLDFNSIVIEDPSRVHVTNGYFLGDGNVILRSNSGRISGLNVMNNMFIGVSNNMVPIVQLEGTFSDVDQVVIDNNHAHGMKLKSTAGKLTVAGNGTKWVADFSPVLVFPNRISHFQYSFYSRGGVFGFPTHVVTNVSGNIVVVESEKPVDAIVSVFVDQSNLFGEGIVF